MFEHFRAANATLADMAGSRPTGRVTASIGGSPEIVTVLVITGNYYGMLGVTAQIGRTIEPADDHRSAPAVAMLSDRYWRSRFAADPAVLGRTITLGTTPVTIVGVVTAAFTGTQRATGQLHDLSVPLSLEELLGADPGRLSDPTDWWLQILGRLKPGVTPLQVRGNFEGIFQSQARAGMAGHLASLPETERSLAQNQQRRAVPRLLIDSGSRGTYDAETTQVRGLAIIGGVVGLVLLLVAANVANLLLARISSRAREISVRMAMGATRMRMIRQLLTESLLLAGTGGALGALLAHRVQDVLPPAVRTSTPHDWQIVAFLVVLVTATGVAVGIAPALRATQWRPHDTLKENNRSIAGSTSLLSRALLIVQVAISLTLVIGAGLFLRTLDNLQRVNIGFDPDNLLFVRVNPDPNRHSPEYLAQYFRRGLERLEALPGVRAATVSAPTLLSGGEFGTAMYVTGREYPQRRYVSERDDISRVVVAPSFFQTMGIPLVAGRLFSDGDDARAPSVAIINQAAARKFFPNENPLGRRFGHSIENKGPIEIVGVLRDVRYNSLRDPPPPTLYVPYLQHGTNNLVFSVRTEGDSSGLMRAARAAIGEVDRSIPVVTVETQISQIEQRYGAEKLLAQACVLFGVIALFIAAIGLFGLLSYNVSRRTREIGIRMAIGAQRESVLDLVVRESMILVVAGISVGLMLASIAGRMMAPQLFGLTPTDLPTLAGATALTIAVSIAAGYLPARRATRVDPMVALRYE
jgi:predicted permease